MEGNTSQVNILDEIIVDNFAGGGGASTGIELATGRVVALAINHDADAVRMHQANHPYTVHLQTDVWDVDPVEVCAGRPVGLAWFSPDCKHFSRAKGAALVDKHIRGLAWIALRWAGTVRPRVIMLENVPEFVTWGPVRHGRPKKSKKGQTFRKFVGQLRDLGYDVQWRELVAADFGAPTIRKRFVLCARCDGRPIVWPEPTHAPADSAAVTSGKKKPWRSAAEIIDWSIPAYSVFASKQELKDKYGVTAVRPLADNTMRRVIRGVDKFTIRSGKPFIIPTGYGERKGQAPRVNDPEVPLSTVVSTVKQNLCTPVIMQCKFSNPAQGTDKPLSTITAVGSHELAAPCLIQYHTEQTGGARADNLDAPLKTVDAANRYGLVTAQMVEYYGNGKPLDIADPLHTATSHDRNAVVAAHLAEFKGKDIGQSAGMPLRTVTAGGGEFAVCAAEICKVDVGMNLHHWPKIRALLNRYCGYAMADDEILLLVIDGVSYFIADILMRMLTPRELYNAMGFPPDYKIALVGADGKPYSKAAQIARCGNAVCPPIAAAMVRSNLQEWCGFTITTMAQLSNIVAV